MKNLILLFVVVCLCLVGKAQCGSANYVDPQFTINVQNPACPITGEITVTSASGGTTPYSYTLLPNHITNSTGTFSNLSPGTYYVQLQDACGTIRTRQATISPYSFTASVSMNSLGCRKFQFNLTSTASSHNLQYGYWLNGSTDTTWATNPQIEATLNAPVVVNFIVRDECGNTATADQYIPKETGGYIKKLNERIKCNGQEIYPEYYGFEAPSVCLYKYPQRTLVECKQAPSGYNGGALTNFFDLPFGQDYYVIVQDACYRDSAFFKDKTSAGGSELNPFAWHCNTFDIHADGNNYDTVCLWNATTNTLVSCKPWTDTTTNPNTGLHWPYGGAEWYNLPYGHYYAFIYDPCMDTLLRLDTTVRYPYKSFASGFGNCMVGQSAVAVNYSAETPLPWTTKVYWPNDSLVGTYQSSGANWYHYYPTYPGAGNIKVVTQDGCGKTDTTYIIQSVVVQPSRRKEVIGGCPGIYGPSGGGDIVLHGNAAAYANLNGFPLGRVKIISKDGQPAAISQSYTRFNGGTNEQDYYFTNLSTGTYVVESALGCTDYKVYDTVTINPYVYPGQAPTTIPQCGSNPVTFRDTATGGVAPLTFEVLQTIPNIPSLITGPQASNTFTITPGSKLDTVKIRVIDNCGNSNIEEFPVSHLSSCEILPVGDEQNVVVRNDALIHLFPNPFSTEFFVKISKRKKSSYRINVTNVLGIAVYARIFENIDTQTIKINLSGSKGVYFVQIDDLKANNTYRFKQVAL